MATEGLNRSKEHHPDLIITDVVTPHLSGVEMIRAIREVPRWQQTPILAITAYGMETAQAAIEAGANRAMAHPIKSGLLMAFIEGLSHEIPEETTPSQQSPQLLPKKGDDSPPVGHSCQINSSPLHFIRPLSTGLSDISPDTQTPLYGQL